MSASQVVHHALSIVCAVSFTDDFTLLYSCMQFNDILWPQQWRWGYLGWLVVSALGETLLIRERAMMAQEVVGVVGVGVLTHQYTWAIVGLCMRGSRTRDKGGIKAGGIMST